jgi:hypothetical protein
MASVYVCALVRDVPSWPLAVARVAQN